MPLGRYVWVVVTHEGHGEETMVQGVYTTEKAAQAALAAAIKRVRDNPGWLGRRLYGNVEQHRLESPDAPR
jgi:hypothetical protein